MYFMSCLVLLVPNGVVPTFSLKGYNLEKAFWHFLVLSACTGACWFVHPHYHIAHLVLPHKVHVVPTTRSTVS